MKYLYLLIIFFYSVYAEKYCEKISPDQCLNTQLNSDDYNCCIYKYENNNICKKLSKNDVDSLYPMIREVVGVDCAYLGNCKEKVKSIFEEGIPRKVTCKSI